MRKTDLPFNNAGGVRHIIAIPANSFTGLTISGDGTFSINASDLTEAVLISQEYQEGHVQENKKESDNGDQFEVDISGVIYGDSANNDDIVDILSSGSWVVLAETNNKVWKVFGGFRTKLVFEVKHDSGQSFSDLNSKKFSFSALDDCAAVRISSPL